MQRPKIDVQQRKLSDLLHEMETGKLQVPRFQREFVWPLTKTRALLDSMYKEFPIGTFFLWRAPDKSPPLSRALKELGIPAPQDGADISYILDGQQRLTSLFVAINGLKLGSADYGRISIDLEKATLYEQTNEEGFEEDIFVYRSGDNERYVAVHELAGQNALMIFDGIPREWKPAYNKAHNMLQTYPFSVVWIQEQQLSDAIEIFQRINQAGQRLSRYDLICANVWTEDFDFRKQVDTWNKQFAQQGFGKLQETIFTQAFALILNSRCTTAAELSLQTEEIKQARDRAIRALQLAVDFAVHTLGVKRYDFLPYRGILAVLAFYFYHKNGSSLTAQEREGLWNWFWRVTLSERYSSTSPSRMAEDAEKLKEMMHGKDIAFDYPIKVTPETVRRTKMTSTSSALRNAFLCMLALKAPLNFKDGSHVNLSDDFFSNVKKAERHHIFPVSYLKEKHEGSLVHLIPNFCFIPADLNREIGSQAPATYLSTYRGENPDFAAAAASHLLPVEPVSKIWANDYQGFLVERAQRIAQELNRLIQASPGEFVREVFEEELSPHAKQVDAMEIRIRDFIDHRLTAVTGAYYWKHTVPNDVKASADRRIDDYLARHPYEDRSEFASGRSRLDFCDVSHYEKIVISNWDQFSPFLGRKEEFQRHASAFRILRNCVQHNREPSEVERKNGEAALTWLRLVVDKYENEVSAYEVEAEQGDLSPEELEAVA